MPRAVTRKTKGNAGFWKMPRKDFHRLHGVALFRKRPRNFCISLKKGRCLHDGGLLIFAAQNQGGDDGNGWEKEKITLR